MNTVPQLAIVSAAAFLSATVPQQRGDLKMTSPDGVQRIDQLWMVTYIDGAGRETVAQAKLTSGDFAPLIAADAARLESIMSAARGIATANNINMRLVKFTSRVNVEDISGDALNAGYLYLEVKCLGCNTHQTVALDIIRRPKTTPIHELERRMRCKDCSEIRRYPYKRSHLVALRSIKISANDPPSTWWTGER
jgi:hypothetical protein